MQEPLLPSDIVMPSRTVIGRHTVFNLVEESIMQFGEPGVLVHGASLKKSGVLEKILQGDKKNKVALFFYSGGEPKIEDAEKLLNFARENKAKWIAGVGGGSVMDIAKVAAGLFNEEQCVEHYHDGGRILKAGIPFVAVPTTAGTGSEATINAVLTNKNKMQKKSIRHPNFIPRLVFLDAALLDSCPQKIIAQAGLDALTQAIEGYTSKYATWLTDCYTLQAVKMIAGNLVKVFQGERGKAAEDLLIGSYLAGIGFSMAKLGVVHGIAHPLGVRYEEPHGLICGIVLPYALEINRSAYGKKYEVLAQVFGADPVNFVKSLLDLMNVKSPFIGKPLKEKDAIIAETVNAFSTQANPKKITSEDVEYLLSKIF